MVTQATQLEKKNAYDAILKLYDCAEDIVSAIEAIDPSQAEKSLMVAEPVIEQLEETAGVLSETFIIFGETGDKLDIHNKKRAETAIRKLYVTLGVFCESIGDVLLGIKVNGEEFSANIRTQILSLQEKAKRKFGEKVERLFNIMLWIGDYLVKLANQMERVGTGLQPALAIPGYGMQPVANAGKAGFLHAAEHSRGDRSWSL